ncbi:hypothetical protein J7426_00275 [Tropicibacter sp. R16_0]|uniref:hypothetical protein n=1 Tax=Tropicibacter sp. R16_0 TaxID=2821102 RepID=UPI001AD9EA36|nr:hypothetical protein [Tropicibacter sp. R16_0]MBO9448672.1 hypothetical protein [Tropicibacter sp. R16_0]
MADAHISSEVSNYQAFKLWLAHYVPIDRDILHVLIGALVLISVLALSRRKLGLRPGLQALAISFALAVAMEALDLRDDLKTLSRWRWQESLADILRTIAIPLLACGWMWAVRRSGRQ